MTDFSSVDRLMELGLGMALAQQMINTMNYSMANMKVPGVNAAPNQNPPIAYFAIIDNAQLGPLNEDELIKLITHHKIGRDTLMWTHGNSGWKRAFEIPYIYKFIVLAENG